MNHTDPIRVIIRNPEGQYLTQGRKGWEFTRERTKAIVFDFKEDHIAEHLALIRKAQGPALEAVAAEAAEIHETCDGCQRTVKAYEAFFDGNRLLCAACRSPAGPGPVGDRAGV
jgi:hypothetical protein